MLGLRLSGGLTLLKAKYGAQSAIKFFDSCRFSVMGGDDVFKLNMAARADGAVTVGYLVFIDAMRKCKLMLQQLRIQSGSAIDSRDSPKNRVVSFAPSKNTLVYIFGPAGGASVRYDNQTQIFRADYDIKCPFWKYTFSEDSAEIFIRATLSFAFSSQFEFQSAEITVSSNAELTLNAAGVLRVIRRALDVFPNNTPPCAEFPNKPCAV
ncbi:hypothetical protein B0H17DRAFT_1206536 [Mycena rosella]|uniref:Uncharacterized protein n=1 Tax=Mycena rosella TaxID=1033263 RepID=A0AAD7GDC3_MYCRO|nr:hypothetical protein B0H17DRAFT_1206536 [Mycena rosella]